MQLLSLHAGPPAMHATQNLVCVAVDGIETATNIVPWAVTNVVQPSDELSIIHVDIKAVRRSWTLAGLCETACSAEEDDTTATPERIIEAAMCSAQDAGMDPHRVHSKVLPSFGSQAQTAGAAISDYVEADARNKLLVVGTRGMGAITRAMMSLVGLGSISSYLVHRTTLPVAVVRLQDNTETQPTAAHARRHVLVAIDASAQARGVVTWVLDNLLRPDKDTLHVISVAEPPPPPVIDEMGVHSIMLEAFSEQVAAATGLAWEVARAGADLAREHPGLHRTDLVKCQALDPVLNLMPDTSSGTADAISRYADAHQIDLLVLGRRGQGFGSTLRNLTGLGSVSSHLTCNAHCPVIIIRPLKEEASGELAGGAPA